MEGEDNISRSIEQLEYKRSEVDDAQLNLERSILEYQRELQETYNGSTIIVSGLATAQEVTKGAAYEPIRLELHNALARVEETLIQRHTRPHSSPRDFDAVFLLHLDDTDLLTALYYSNIKELVFIENAPEE